jgi:hypothetical protein
MGFPLHDRTKKIRFFIISQLVDEERRKEEWVLWIVEK